MDSSAGDACGSENMTKQQQPPLSGGEKQINPIEMFAALNEFNPLYAPNSKLMRRELINNLVE